MSIQIASGPIELSHDLDLLQSFNLPPESEGKVCEFFANGTRRGTLAMRSTHDRNVGVLFTDVKQPLIQTVQLRQHHFIQRMMQHQCIAQVVDIFGCARKMQILFQFLKLFLFLKLLL